jgi:hypothetical protein
MTPVYSADLLHVFQTPLLVSGLLFVLGVLAFGMVLRRGSVLSRIALVLCGLVLVASGLVTSAVTANQYVAGSRTLTRRLTQKQTVEGNTDEGEPTASYQASFGDVTTLFAFLLLDFRHSSCSGSG